MAGLNRVRRLIGLLFALSAILASASARANPPKPPAIIAEGVPAVTNELADATRPYMEARVAHFASWRPVDRSMLIATRFGSVPQLHTVREPLGMRRQISFEGESIRFGAYSPGAGDVLVVQKDEGGNEAYQLYTLASGRLRLLTDGRSRNLFGSWSRDGKLIGYSSTRRNGADADLYVMDPRDPRTDRMIRQVSGGGWQIRDFAPDGRSALVGQSLSVTHTKLFELDLATGRLTPLTSPDSEAYYRGGRYDPQGRIWVVSDWGSEFQRLGALDRRTGRFVPVSTGAQWDVEAFDLDDEGRFVAFVVNQAGISHLKVLDTGAGTVREVKALPSGVVTGLDVAPWGEIAVALSSPRYPLDVFSADPRTLRVRQWTSSETGGLDPSANIEPELVSIKSFDGLPVSGFLYRPAPARFPGKRPLMLDIHGGPEAQARPIYQFGGNYLLNELGIAIFQPNVRGSTGFGKRFVSLDDGPYNRESAVRDVRAFLDHLGKDARLDSDRFGVTGASYGGYMCYASAIEFGSRLRAAACEVAVSNFVTVLESMESYRRDLRRPEYGDERDPAQRAKLIAISPLTRAKEIRIPLLVTTGANDPRVPKSEADQIVAAVRANGREVWRVEATNEGHGFLRKENEDYRFWATLLFWRRHLLNQP